eukprot:CAMPEP_0178435972 /NCGR_PEP_ID=MMETSP0689_2-20121128/34201_1 /TAXON_ID=160604 /ORGANISM="Amphidinium massartii, Strain CS-259" /LENGTH=482 /DNA_ID=CAMNT_0020058057 /DNA_START=70 /DNA_END=1518 /DNA_ORIENTATION=+
MAACAIAVVAAGLLLPAAALETRSGFSGSRLSAVAHEVASFNNAYDYSHHGQDWVQGSCSSRERQSPVDLQPSTTSPSSDFLYMYSPLQSEFPIYNNGHTLSADLVGLGVGGITFDGSWYNLLNVNVHAASEHTFGGAQKPLELHLVHKRHDNDQLLVVAVLFDCQRQPTFLQTSAEYRRAGYVPPPDTDANYNPTVQALLSVAPPTSGAKVLTTPSLGAPFDLVALLQGGTFIEYAGSTTAPPCAELVTWLVRRETLMVSDAQAQLLHTVIYSTTSGKGNFRAVMPMNGRQTAIRRAVAEVASAAAMKVDVPGASGQPGREYRAMQWAKDALRISKSAVDYVKDLDQRELAAARARMDIFAPLTTSQATITSTPAPVVTMAASAPAAAMGPQDMQAAVRQMAGLISQAANEAVASAVHQISAEARTAAFSAAKDAADAAQSQFAAASKAQAPSPAPPAAPKTPAWLSALAPAGWVQARIAN